LQALRSKLLKKDIFGSTERLEQEAGSCIRRDAGNAAAAVRWIARWLLAREAQALAVLAGLPGIPELLTVTDSSLEREYLPGVPMQVGKPTDPDFFRSAARLIRRMHRRGVVHNDLAKEPNFLVMPDGAPAIIDFQLAWRSPSRGRLFRTLAREDIRHLLKHKRTYCPDRLTRRERRILDSPSVPAHLWMRTGKPVYLFVTRRILGWRDREGAGDRF
jgi:RIO-like serine/threonine protein kinase